MNIEIHQLLFYIENKYPSNKDVYRCLYRMTDRFDWLEVDIVKNDIDKLAKEGFHYNEIADVKRMLETGDNGTYNPPFVELTNKDYYDVETVTNYVNDLLSGEYEKAPNDKRLTSMEKKIKGYNLLGKMYDKYKDFKFEVEALDYGSRGNGHHLDYLGELFNRWEREAEPFLRLIADNNRVEIEEKRLPDELNTDDAKEILQKAIDAGLCDENYKWLRTEALLAHFAYEVSKSLKLGKGEYNGEQRIAWKPFETLFKVTGLCSKYKDYDKKDTLPLGYEIVKALLK